MSLADQIQTITPEEGKDFELLYTLREYPVFVAPILKSGCTFIKNLLYYIDHGKLNPHGDMIHHDETGLLRGQAMDLPVIEQSPYVFMVVREPMDRFLSLYYDKIYGTEIGSMDWFRKTVGKDINMNFGKNLTLEQHQKNTISLIKWIAKNLGGKTEVFADYHWRRQVYRWRRLEKFPLKVLVLDDLDRQLAHLLGPIIPDIAKKMAEVKSRNHSARPFTYEETRSEELDELVVKTYKSDVGLVQDARAYWNGVLGS